MDEHHYVQVCTGPAHLDPASPYPILFRNAVADWPKITPEHLATEYGDLEMEFQFGNRQSVDIAWESALVHSSMTLSEFTTQYLTGKPLRVDLPNESQIDISRATHWGYASYKHLKHTFTGAHASFMKLINWGQFGLDEDGERSTFWFGSEGAGTQCHYDTYGWNIVAQLYGTKRWTLFPPSQSRKLYGTRVPYEESSVFSQVNIDAIDPLKFPEFSGISCQTVTLQAGDALYVPRHWWHHVRCDDVAISVNLWSPHPRDSEARVSEGLVRLLVSTLLDVDLATTEQDVDECVSKWINPSEELQQLSVGESLDVLRSACEECFGVNRVALRDLAKCLTTPEVLTEVVAALKHSLGK